MTMRGAPQRAASPLESFPVFGAGNLSVDALSHIIGNNNITHTSIKVCVIGFPERWPPDLDVVNRNNPVRIEYVKHDGRVQNVA